MATLTLEVEVAHLWIVATLSHLVTVHVLSWVAGEIGLVLNQHRLIRELLVHLDWAAKALALLIEKDAIVLCLCDLLVHAHRRVLLLTASEVYLLLDLPGLVSRHKLLSVLVRVCQLTCAFFIKIALRTLFEFTGPVVNLNL